MFISIVIPVYGCTSCLEELSYQIQSTLVQISDDFEIILINDGSPDNSWEIICDLAKTDERIKGINLSRNFGQHKAITAGLDYADGDWVVVMDCDLQDQPKEILNLYNKTQEGFDIVFGKRIDRKDSFYKKMSSAVFYKIYNYFTDNEVDNSIANFSIISKKVVLEFRLLHEQDRLYPLFVNWLGFKRTNIDIDHSARKKGDSSYTFKKLLDLAIDSIVAQSNKPLKISIKFGFFISILSLFYAFWLFVRYFIYYIPVEGWTSVIVSIYFIGGLLFANLGVLGLYIGKTFNETKNRPLYVIESTTYSKEK